MLLANGVNPVFFLAGGAALGAASIAIALAIETPVLRWWWRRPGVWRSVLVANAVSLVVGCLPICGGFGLLGPADPIDPWAWHQAAWQRVLAYCGALFIVTVAAETIVYAVRLRRATTPVAFKRIASATLVANALSYAPLVAWLVADARAAGDFEFLPDTSWVRGGSARVYFVDPATDQLYSIRLDGADRRLETPAPVGRVEGDFSEISYYAVLADNSRIVFVGTDLHWHVTDGESTNPLAATLPIESGRCARRAAARSLRDALTELGLPKPTSNDDSVAGAELSYCTPLPWNREASRLPQYEIDAGAPFSEPAPD